MSRFERMLLLLALLLVIGALLFSFGAPYHFYPLPGGKVPRGYKINRWTGTATLLEGNREFALESGGEYRPPTAPPPPGETIERGANTLLEQFFKGIAQELQRHQGTEGPAPPPPAKAK